LEKQISENKPKDKTLFESIIFMIAECAEDTDDNVQLQVSLFESIIAFMTELGYKSIINCCYFGLL
jgi:hypothetical protein